MLRSIPVLALLLSSAPAQQLARHEFESPHMGTLFKIILYATDADSAENAASSAFELAGKLDACFSDYEADSELNRLHESRDAVTSPELFDILTIAKNLCQKTDGAFDITTGNHTRNWRRARITGKLPTEKQIASAKATSGWRKLKLEADTRRITLEQGVRIDLGGIAKGYAADAMLALLRRNGFPIASIAAGGDIAVSDPPPGKTGWKIAIAPDGNRATRTLSLANQAVSTSGNAEQRHTIEGKTYSHIVDPETGLGLTESSPVSVVARRATLTDAYATALNVLGQERSKPIVKQQQLTAIWGESP
jgi:thiamine biosynthesis lipoprotein